MLDAKTWEEGALPAMGPKHRYQTYPSGKRDANLDSNFYFLKQDSTDGA